MNFDVTVIGYKFEGDAIEADFQKNFISARGVNKLKEYYVIYSDPGNTIDCYDGEKFYEEHHNKFDIKNKFCLL